MTHFFKNFYRYRHDSTLDIDLDVLNIRDKGGVYQLYVMYWNRHSKFHQGDREWVTINKADLPKWKQVGVCTFA